MINIILKRLALAIAALWVALTFLDFGLVFGLTTAAVFLGFVWVLCWILGPIGRFGSSQEQYGYHAQKAAADLKNHSYH